MSCISSNFSSFFLNSLNDPSEFSKYLSNGELKCTNFEEFQVFAQSTQQQQQQQQQQQYLHTNGVGSVEFGCDAATSQSQRDAVASAAAATSIESTALPASQPLLSNRWPTAVATPNGHAPASTAAQHFDGSFEFIKYLRHSTDFTPNSGSGAGSGVGPVGADGAESAATADKCSKLTTAAAGGVGGGGAAVRATTPPLPASPVGASGGVGLLDLDSTSISQKSRSASRKVAALLSSVSRSSNSLDANSSTLDAVFDHDSKQTIFELQHMTSTSNGSNASNSNESSLELLAFPSSHLNASNSNTSSEEHCGSAGEFGGLLSGASCSSASAAGSAPKLLGSFVIKENFDVHPSHKVEEGIFQHMNKLPSKKKDTLKQLGVRFTGQMTLTDKSIVVENFIKFCEEYDIKDHRPWLSLNQCGLNKPEQIKFARYLGQGLPTFTLFCIYSNFKNLFCTKRTEIYTKDGYNLPYILDKTKRFLANTTAGENTNNNNNKTNTTTTTTTSTPVKQTQEQCNSSTHLHTQQTAAQSQPQPSSAARTMTPTCTAMPRPGTPTTPAATSVAGGATTATVMPTTPHPQHSHLMQPHTPHHLQQQQQPSTPTRGTPMTPQQQQHPHSQPHHHQQQHQHPQHHVGPPHPHQYSHPHQQQHPHPHPHPQQHPHPHHFAYAHPHHTHYGLPPHPHSHPHSHPHPHPHAHMAAAMGYGQQVAPPAPSSVAQPPQLQSHALPPSM
ncbi:hypothetical protein ACLKA6_011739 [Drosophila palustris]